MKPQIKSPKNLTFYCCSVLDKTELLKPYNWSITDVTEWISNLGFPQYIEVFKKNFINGRKLVLVNSQALIKMNIQKFEHIKIITASIRNIFQIEQEKFARDLSLPIYEPATFYKFFKSNSGESYDTIKLCDFLIKTKIIKKNSEPLNHFEKLYEWFKHFPDDQGIRIGLIKGPKTIKVKNCTNDDISVKSQNSKILCSCDIPPCECNWTLEELKNDLKISILNNI